MFNTIYQIARTMRPRQWLKNLSVFAAATFFGNLFHPEIFWACVQAFFAFSFLSSGVYFINDIIDAPKDRMHPIKKNRPIASHKLTESTAWVIAFMLITSSVFYSLLFLGSFFTLSMVFYVLIQLAYSLYFRNVIILDSLLVASGFVLRVFAGGFATQTSLSSWLVLTTIGLSMLLAFGKRRSEKTILAKHLTSGEIETRKTLRHYPDHLLDNMLSISSSLTIISYALFAFQISPQDVSPTMGYILPSILRSPKWMMLTIPLIIYGIARYMYVIYEKGEGESPERVLLSDRPLFYSVILWGICVLVIVYLLPIKS